MSFTFSNLARSSFALFLLAANTAWGVSSDDIGFVTASSIPPQVITAFAKFPAADQYAFSAHINPFYLQGDFNGDGKLDTAINIKQKATEKIGIAIIHGGSNKIQILGAGHDFDGGDDFSWQDAWYSYAKGKVGQGADETRPPKLIGDAIMTIKTEASSGLIYWTGSQYRWYQQGD